MGVHASLTLTHGMQSLAMPLAASCVALSIAFFFFHLVTLAPASGPKPPQLQDTIPFVSNTYQYLTDVAAFYDRVTKALKEGDIVKFHLGFRSVYLLARDHVQAVFGPPSIADPNMLHVLLMEAHWALPGSEIKRFADDKSGKLKIPLPGTEHVPPSDRHWYNHHQVYAKYLLNTHSSNAMGDTFYDFLTDSLDHHQPLTMTWKTVRVFDTLRHQMATSAIKSMFGTRILDLNPRLLEAYFDFDEVAGKLVYGLPRFIDPKPARIRNRLLAMTTAYVESAWEHFDWDGPDAEADWDPHFGSRFSREIAKWVRASRFSDRVASGHAMATLFGLNGNTLPVTAWALMELVRDPPLLKQVQEEVGQAFTVDMSTGRHVLDTQKLLSLPLLNSIYIEVLRMHVSFSITREAQQDIRLGDYQIPKHSLIQAPTHVAHYDEALWHVAEEEPPLSIFWAARHLVYDETVNSSGELSRTRRLSIRAGQNGFFPYGGGTSMCPGRQFAKREILMTLAVVLEKFDVEFIDWIHPDGKVSDRPAQGDRKYAGVVAVPPDRDMLIRWRRKW